MNLNLTLTHFVVAAVAGMSAGAFLSFVFRWIVRGYKDDLREKQKEMDHWLSVARERTDKQIVAELKLETAESDNARLREERHNLEQLLNSRNSELDGMRQQVATLRRQADRLRRIELHQQEQTHKMQAEGKAGPLNRRPW